MPKKQSPAGSATEATEPAPIPKDVQLVDMPPWSDQYSEQLEPIKDSYEEILDSLTNGQFKQAAQQVVEYDATSRYCFVSRLVDDHDMSKAGRLNLLRRLLTSGTLQLTLSD